MTTEAGRKTSGASIRAAFVSPKNPHRIELMSGTPYFMLRALEKRFNMVSVIEDPWPFWFKPVGHALRFVSGKQFEYKWSPLYTKLAAQRTVRRLRAAKPDIVFAVMFSPLAHALTKHFNVVHICDATLRAMIGYYDGYKRFPRFALEGADRIEATTIRQSFLALFPMRWALDSAFNDYGASPDRTFMIPWGANLDTSIGEARSLPEDEIRLLFVGVDWNRKGGQIALDTASELTRRGVKCRLDIVGCTPPNPPPSNVVVHGFVSKATSEGATLINRLYSEATFFLLPTLAECAGMSFGEAIHSGVPPISYATGGLPSVILSGRTGQLLPIGVPASAFADEICELIAKPELYQAMSAAALGDARNRLNWEIWADGVEATVERGLAAKG